MNHFCSSNPCFLAQEKTTEVQIPLIYQSPHRFYFPNEMPTPLRLTHSNHRKDEVSESPKYHNRYIDKTNLQTEPSLWGSHEYYSNFHNTSQKQLGPKKQVKQNIAPTYLRNQRMEESVVKNKIYFNYELSKCKSLQKQQKSAVKSTRSSQNFTQIYVDANQNRNPQIAAVPSASQYNSLLQSNQKLKKIIEEEYRPLKTSYQTLMQEQKQRERLILMLEHKVRQLGQKLGSQNGNPMKFSRH